MPCHTHKHWNSGLCKPLRGSGQMVVVSGVSWIWTFDDSYCFAWPACPLTCFWGSLWPRRRMSVVWRSSEWKTTTGCLLDAHNDQQTPNNQRHNQNQNQKNNKTNDLPELIFGVAHVFSLIYVFFSNCWCSNQWTICMLQWCACRATMNSGDLMHNVGNRICFIVFLKIFHHHNQSILGIEVPIAGSSKLMKR